MLWIITKVKTWVRNPAITHLIIHINHVKQWGKLESFCSGTEFCAQLLVLETSPGLVQFPTSLVFLFCFESTHSILVCAYWQQIGLWEWQLTPNQGLCPSSIGKLNIDLEIDRTVRLKQKPRFKQEKSVEIYALFRKITWMVTSVKFLWNWPFHDSPNDASLLIFKPRSQFDEFNGSDFLKLIILKTFVAPSYFAEGRW